MQKSASPTDRLASCWFSSTHFTIDLNLTDGVAHQVGLYLIDWDGSNVRQDKIEILDASTNAVLDTQTVTSYSNGKYLKWSLKGHVKIKFTHLSPGGYSAVVSALLFDLYSDAVAGGVNYVLADVQGSARAVMNNSGGSSTVIARHDYLPFGEEIAVNTGSRSTGQGYAPSAVNQNRLKYALTERDSNGLDHTWWRKHDGAAGRWTTSDPYRRSMSTGNPQSFNRYTYVDNDPVNFMDPSGLCRLNFTIRGNITSDTRRRTMNEITRIFAAAGHTVQFNNPMGADRSFAATITDATTSSVARAISKDRTCVRGGCRAPSWAKRRGRLGRTLGISSRKQADHSAQIKAHSNKAKHLLVFPEFQRVARSLL